MANEYQNFTNPIIDSESPWQAMNKNLSGISSGALGMFLQQKQQEEAQKQAIAQLMLKNQLEQQNAVALDKAKRQNEFDVQGDTFNRSLDWMQKYPDVFNEQPHVIQYQNMNKSSGSMNPILSQPTMKIDPSTGSIKSINKKPPTAVQETTALYASRIKQANDVFNGMEKYINNLPVVGTKLNQLSPNFLKSEDYQAYEQAQRNFLNAVLRRESGAVISPSEFAEGRKQYFPQPGDKPSVLKQKKLNRDLVMKNFIASSRDAYVPYQELDSNIGQNQQDNDPLGLR